MTTLADIGPIILADNGSTDGTADMVRALFPSVTVLEFADNLGAVARNHAVALVTTIDRR